MQAEDKELFAVIGGCGFLGRYVVESLLERGNRVRVIDLRQTWDDDRFEFVAGDITQIEQVEEALQGVSVVIHTASPPHGLGYNIYYKVNVEGTRNIVDTCVRLGVSRLIYTSSASVVFDGKDIKGGDESLPYCKKHLDGYTHTKELGERIVLEANGKEGLNTVALRPSGIFGPGDRQAWPGFIDAARAGKSKYQLGQGKNLMDYTFVENVAYAHLLAAERLAEDTENIGGQAFFITNDEPIPFWDMAKYIWRNLDYPEPSIVVPYWLAYYLSLVLDWIVWLISPVVTLHPTFTFFRVAYAGADRYFTIDKAKKILGYKPPVSLQDGMERTLQAFEHMRNKEKNKKEK